LQEYIKLSDIINIVICRKFSEICHEMYIPYIKACVGRVPTLNKLVHLHMWRSHCRSLRIFSSVSVSPNLSHFYPGLLSIVVTRLWAGRVGKQGSISGSRRDLPDLN
jgi:hypothetical protein